MRVEVVRPGLLTTVQDLGRTGSQPYGVPVAGAMDGVALRLANLLVGNAPGEAALEMTLHGAALRFADERWVAVCGAEMDGLVGTGRLEPWRAYRLRPGDVLDIGAARAGCRAYLAISGGIAVPPVLGSRSTYLLAGLGGLHGRALRSGDVLPLGAPSAEVSLAAGARGAYRPSQDPRWSVARQVRPWYVAEPLVRLLPGHHESALTEESRQALFSAAFRVSPDSDRVGYRLVDAPLRTTGETEIRSEGLTHGTVQLPPGGDPVVLMADRPTTGGYPRIGEIATVDLPLVAQLRPGDTLRFRPCKTAEAERAFADAEARIARFADAIRLSRRFR